MSDKKRVDVALVERGLAQSREKAQALVMSGVVYNSPSASSAVSSTSENTRVFSVTRTNTPA